MRPRMCIIETYCGLAALFLFNSLLSLATMFYYVSLSHCSFRAYCVNRFTNQL